MRLNRRVLAAVAFFAIPVIALVTRQADAWPTNSPSARAAARLKYYPPRNWIRHYLGDDRYKIAGGVWNVVSTQTDTYYHRATCPNMLRQSADIVIGFNKSSEADEAGYRADPMCQPGATAYIYAASSSTSATSVVKRFDPELVAGNGRRRIYLADGLSTVVMPQGWVRLGSSQETISNTPLTDDYFSPQYGIRPVMVITTPLPPSIQAGKTITPQVARALVEEGLPYLTAERGKVLTPQMQNGFKNFARAASYRTASFGGLRGAVATMKFDEDYPNSTMRVWVAARGSKLFVIVDAAERVSETQKLLSSLRPR